MTRERIGIKTKDRYKQRIKDVIRGLSRKVLVYRNPIKSECPNCFYDKMTDKSTNKCKWTPVEAIVKQNEWESEGNTSVMYKYFLHGRCPICKGVGYLEEEVSEWVSCLVTWNPGETGFGGNSIIATPAGSEDATVVRLKTDVKYQNLFNNAIKMVIDGIECKLSSPPVVRGIGIESVLVVIAFTSDKIVLDREDIIKRY